ncbi:MAG TPA: 2-amino-3,7-dideoxy-D-threo-hept-6-ulosonate synthase [Amycolatopsis sp.]|uniref:2-amino-3,7-dideoxy-D-threo-hept-6-ulosonate synthase n=1 Tax=Amycolatopsis sp. TaxID=37632 RepID=UPI002B4659EC|nr:2-amino-3,7-dideoxy-D-threo-hept-6-ulosonate synthase [Amycolatopsis sp.]HKS46154.1 2-amino-3,7-dideoxy-D-threo-hept-6-ulosonate synthase [Amycolatopsis sp.]
MATIGKSFRMRRLSRTGDGRHLFVPLDHSVSEGPVVPQARWRSLVRAVVEGGADAIVVHKGRARTIPPDLLGACALVVHLSAGTAHAPDTHAKVLVGAVEEAVRLGADAVSVHVNLGSETESAQLADLGAVAGACDTWSIPLLAMIYPRGPHIADPHDPALLTHAVNIGADLGADLVKTSVPLRLAEMAAVVDNCPIPVLAAGGPPDGSDPVDYATSLMLAGCRGLAIGRRVFSSPSPGALVSRLADVVHFSDVGPTNPTTHRTTMRTGAA